MKFEVWIEHRRVEDENRRVECERSGMVWYGKYGLVWSGMVWYGMHAMV